MVKKQTPEAPKRIIGDFLKIVGGLLLFSIIAKFGYSDPQKAEIRGLYGDKCQFPGCKLARTGTLHVHHISPDTVSKYDGMRPEQASNGLPFCEYHHLGSYEGIHPDNVIALAYYNKKLDSLEPIIRNKYPQLLECFIFFVQKAKEFDKKPRDPQKKDRRHDAYSVVLREWRNSKMHKGEPYWNTENDRHFQTLALETSMEAQRNGWQFPLKEFHSSIITNSAEFVWDNMATVLVERYLHSLHPTQFKRILLEMNLSKVNSSRKVYLERIYRVAVQNYDDQRGVIGIVARYIQSLSKEEYKRKANFFNGERNRNKQFDILVDEFYTPAMQMLVVVNNKSRT